MVLLSQCRVRDEGTRGVVVSVPRWSGSMKGRGFCVYVHGRLGRVEGVGVGGG